MLPRAHFAGLTTSFAISTLSQNTAATSASLTVAHVSPVRAGRKLTLRDRRRLVCFEVGPEPAGPPAKNAAIRAMLRSSAATSTTRAGRDLGAESAAFVRTGVPARTSGWPIATQATSSSSPRRVGMMPNDRIFL